MRYKVRTVAADLIDLVRPKVIFIHEFIKAVQIRMQVSACRIWFEPHCQPFPCFSDIPYHFFRFPYTRDPAVDSREAIFTVQCIGVACIAKGGQLCRTDSRMCQPGSREVFDHCFRHGVFPVSADRERTDAGRNANALGELLAGKTQQHAASYGCANDMFVGIAKHIRCFACFCQTSSHGIHQDIRKPDGNFASNGKCCQHFFAGGMLLLCDGHNSGHQDRRDVRDRIIIQTILQFSVCQSGSGSADFFSCAEHRCFRKSAGHFGELYTNLSLVRCDTA